jgi:hypothetical protein
MARGIVAVIAGLIAAVFAILLIECIGALVAPGGPAPALKDVEQMRVYLAGLPPSANAFLIAAYLVGSATGGVVTGRVMRNPPSRCVWAVGGILLAMTMANLVRIPHPLWVSIASVVAIFAGTSFAIVYRPAVKH